MPSSDAIDLSIPSPAPAYRNIPMSHHRPIRLSPSALFLLPYPSPHGQYDKSNCYSALENHHDWPTADKAEAEVKLFGMCWYVGLKDELYNNRCHHDGQLN